MVLVRRMQGGIWHGRWHVKGHVKVTDLGTSMGVRNTSCRSITSPALELPTLCQAGEVAPNSTTTLAYGSLGHTW